MNRRLCLNRSMVFVSLVVVAGLAGACAVRPGGGVVAGANGGAGFDRAWATREAADLQRRQAAVATAYLSRMDELEASDPNPQDPDHYSGYADAARHMLARATERLNSYGAVLLEGSASEADAVMRADVRRVKSEYVAQAISLQREVVRMERDTGGPFGDDGAETGTAVTDLGVLLSLRSVMVALQVNTGSGAGAAVGAGGGAGVPKVAAGGVNPYTSGSPATDSGGAATDEASKRRGFTSHPGYEPTPK